MGRPHVADVGASSALASSEVSSSSSSVTDSFAVTVNLFRESGREIYAGISVELVFIGNCWPQISLIATTTYCTGFTGARTGARRGVGARFAARVGTRTGARACVGVRRTGARAGEGRGLLKLNVPGRVGVTCAGGALYPSRSW